MDRPPVLEEVRKISESNGFDLSDKELAVIGEYLESQIIPLFAELERMEGEPKILSRTTKRERGYFPSQAENRLGAWAWKCSVKGESGGILSGKRVALKDNISLAGIPMLNGSSLLEGYLPEIDATVVQRVLDSGAEIVGKAVCENFCLSGASNTSYPQPVLNPRNPKYMAGGSSSGCAALIASGEVDMALGGDQGGSIRIPSSWCGIFGLKPTYGLVPYTGIMTGEMSFDHVGPMASNAKDLALLLEATAGRDGLDPRQAMANTPEPGQIPQYSKFVSAGVEGLRVGIVSEGFGLEESEPDVDDLVRRSASSLEKAGAKVSEVSIPVHRKVPRIMIGIDFEGSWRAIKNASVNFGTLGYYDSALARYAGGRLSERKYNAEGFALPSKALGIIGEYMSRNYHSYHYAKSQNLRPSIRKKYDDALSNFDVLVMPTTPQKAQPFPDRDGDKKDSLLNYILSAWNMLGNASPFDYTGHPAMSIPCGYSDGLPVGMMVIGRHFDEATLFRIAGAFEKLSLSPQSSMVETRKP